jgi:small conductance mechanosensitive channel
MALLTPAASWAQGAKNAENKPEKKASSPPETVTSDLQESIAADEKQLAQLKQDLAERQKEFDTAAKVVNLLTADVETRRKDHEALVKEKDAEQIAESKKTLEGLEERLRLAKERLELATSDRRLVQAQYTQLDKKIQEDKKTLAKRDHPAAAPPAAPAAPPAADPTAAVVPGLPSPAPAQPATNKAISDRAAEAETFATKKAAEATAARENAQTLARRRQALKENIELEKTRLATSHKRYDNLTESLMKIEEELFGELDKGTPVGALDDVIKRRDLAKQHLQEVSKELDEHTRRIDELQTQLLGLQQEELEAHKEIKQKEAEAETAQRQKWLVTISDYLIVALPKIAFVLLILFVIYYAIKFLGRRLIGLWASTGRGSQEEGRYRAQTLVSVFENAANTALYVIGALTILDILKVPISTLLGGVAVAGIAVAFGAQNLVRDYFYGFMILLEDQYKINDVVSINNMTGTVEGITLRITTLRDYEGKVYFIPNGLITSVTNLTHEWSRAIVDVRVDQKFDIDEILDRAKQIARDIAGESGFSDGILKPPEVLGVERFEDFHPVIRVTFVTRPPMKDTVRREFLRRWKAGLEK